MAPVNYTSPNAYRVIGEIVLTDSDKQRLAAKAMSYVLRDDLDGFAKWRAGLSNEENAYVHFLATPKPAPNQNAHE